MDEPPSYYLPTFLSGDNLPYIAASAVLLLLCCIISASEAAFFALTSDQVDELRKQRSGKAKFVSELLNNPRELLSAFSAWKLLMVTGCTIIFTLPVHLRSGDGTGVEAPLLTVVFAIFGVILAKIYGASHKHKVAVAFAGVFYRLMIISRPFVAPILKMSYKVERKLEALAKDSSLKELKQALELAAADKNTTKDEKEILKGIVNFGTLTVEDVMRPEAEIDSVDVSLNFHDLLIYIKKSGFSRLPAYRDSFERIEGVLYIKDLLPYLNENKKFAWQKLLRPAYFVEQSRKIDLLLKDFQEKRVHMALAVDESGNVSGIITLEDIIEEIIGDIHDEFDEAGAYYKKLDEKTFVFDSKISVHEFCRILDVDHEIFDTESGDKETLGGLLVEMQNDLPKIGDQIVLDPFTLVIEAIDHKRIKKIRVHIHEQKER